MSALAKKELRLVEVNGKRIMTTSLLVAEKFGRRHDNVLQKIDGLIAAQPEFSRLNFKVVEYIDQKGEARKSYEMTEEGFAMIAMRFTGKAAEEWQIKFVSAFQKMRHVLMEPGRKQEIQFKRDTAREMTDVLKFIREFDGKEVSQRHYTNEHLFCNRALTGKWETINEADLDTYDTRLLAAIRKHNQLLMTRYLKQSDRKPSMDKFVSEYRAKYPRLVLIH